MKVGIIGLPQAGKKTLFEALTNYKIQDKDLISGKAIKGVAEIRDERFDKLCALYSPKKEVQARVDIELLPKIEPDSIKKGDIFKDIAELDAICHLVRGFEDGAVYHVEGSVDTKRDIENVNAELILSDLIFIEKRLARIELNLKKVKKDEVALKERDLLIKFKSHLEEDKPLRILEISENEAKIIASYPFITLKKMITVINVSDNQLQDNSFFDIIQNEYKGTDVYLMQVCAKAEAEIAELDAGDREEFMTALGITEPAINLLSRMCIKALNLISFFTVGEDEVRQWLVKKGASAPRAAGVIHTDLERGFIRSEVIKYNDLVELGSEEAVKAAGKFYLKGKEYIVEDGDILSIRFNV
ncbi:MAG: redox-regulated ATPase YchF [Candidatus Omnitrophota bacterium]